MLASKESTCQCKRRGFDPWVGKIPWRRKWQLTTVFLPGKFHGQRSLAGYSPRGHKESDMTEHECKKKKSLRMLGHISFYLVCIHIQKITKLAFHWSSHQNAMRDCRPFVRPAPRMGDNFSETGSSDWKVKFHSDGKPRWFKFQAVSLPLPSPWEEYTRTTYWLRENEEYVKQNHPLETQRHSCVDVRTGPWKRLSSGELMLSNCGIGDDF